MTAPDVPEAPPRSRLLWGGAVLVFGFCCPVFVPLIAATSWPTGVKSVVSGLLLVGIPELFMLVSVAILGKPGFEYLKAKLFAFFRRHVMPGEVSPARYRIGLLMLSLPLLIGWATPYVELISGFAPNWLVVGIGGDMLILLSLLVLGGDFWDKIRALFLQRAKAHFPPRQG